LFSQMMAVDEASRFHASLKKVRAHTRRLIVNQVLPPSASDCRFCAAKRRVSKLMPLSRHFPQF
jgi:arsenite-transporting ATPase